MFIKLTFSVLLQEKIISEEKLVTGTFFASIKLSNIINDSHPLLSTTERETVNNPEVEYS